ncbi:two-component sensor histidine kinase [Labilibaculum filiforme]|uniref:histidine kinase n=1 Tax=Labilibaculum filiforme TaxID=1940526 RepID=A0A2N3HUZ6_9BACT|nr:ATP-binding protein [Labilibaculum filiforme]PKQ61851.1 two-component sensor histidine kinase [Labilibaculum filiforme]
MLLQIALIASVLLQFGAFFITISLIPKTRFNSSWILVSIGFLLMALRRVIELIAVLTKSISNSDTLTSHWIAVLISLLMFFGAFYIRRIFQLQDKIDKERIENEAKVLSAVIKTEERERHRFAKELHDGLGPILSSIKMTNSALNTAVENEKNKQIASKTDHAVNEAIITIKEISNKLSPHVLERYGLEKAIKTFIEGIHLNNQYQVRLDVRLNNKRFDFNVELILYRIIGELINNTIKHAEASHIDISLLHYPNKLELLYRDNGIGFAIETQLIKGMGLENIRSRVKSLDGTIEMNHKNKQGFYLKVKIPIS